MSLSPASKFAALIGRVASAATVISYDVISTVPPADTAVSAAVTSSCDATPANEVDALVINGGATAAAAVAATETACPCT